jgi:hypothetical protein
MTMIDELNTIVKAYLDYITSLGLAYTYSVNTTFTAYNIKITGPVSVVRQTVPSSVSSGVALDNVVLKQGYIGYTALKTTINPKTASMSLESDFSYSPA